MPGSHKHHQLRTKFGLYSLSTFLANWAKFGLVHRTQTAEIKIMNLINQRYSKTPTKVMQLTKQYIEGLGLPLTLKQQTAT